MRSVRQAVRPGLQSASMKQNGQDLSQRVRIGLTGLACVFLLVLLGAILIKSVNDSQGSGSSVQQGSSGNGPSAGNEQEAPREPLAELGVAPGNAPDTETKPASGPNSGVQ